MDSLTESEMAQIASQQREAGVQRLSSHFSWPDFWDERRRFHQDFVYDVAMLAAARGVPWPAVVRAAALAKAIFPQLDGLDLAKVLSSLRDMLCEGLPSLPPVHRHMLTQFLMHTCVTRRRLLQAAVGGAANISIVQLHLEVLLPPTPCPLAQGTDKHEWERQHQQDNIISLLRQKEEELKVLRHGSRVTVGEISVPDDEPPDREGVLLLVRAAVRAAEGQMVATLNQEASLLSDILQLRLQQAALATGGLHHRSSAAPNSACPDATAKAKQHAAKTKPGLRQSGNAV